MTRIEFIDEQITSARKWTKSLIKRIPDDQWYLTPDVIESNVAWQVGHLAVSQNFNGIIVVQGLNKRVFEQVPLKEYAQLYAMGSKPASEGPTPEELRKSLDFVDELARETLFSLKDEELDQPLMPSKFPHPFAQTKYEALTWNFKHEMWHCGQLALLKRVLKS
ncbi:DinB family protein [bacterium SCSIO 12741]|nr:DinB family protein [bacterium SCSIO 12741]